MKKIITLVAAGMFLFSLQAARAQKEVQPPAIPPMLEEGKPLANPPTTATTASPQPQKAREVKAKPSKGKVRGKSKTARKGKAKTHAKSYHKKTRKLARKKGSKGAHKAKKPAAEPAAPTAAPGPGEAKPGT
jgi:hypothetical protein